MRQAMHYRTGPEGRPVKLGLHIRNRGRGGRSEPKLMDENTELYLVNMLRITEELQDRVVSCAAC